jgi:Mg/Co/Ni transporter MgtE
MSARNKSALKRGPRGDGNIPRFDVSVSTITSHQRYPTGNVLKFNSTRVGSHKTFDEAMIVAKKQIRTVGDSDTVYITNEHGKTVGTVTQQKVWDFYHSS